MKISLCFGLIIIFYKVASPNWQILIDRQYLEIGIIKRVIFVSSCYSAAVAMFLCLKIRDYVSKYRLNFKRMKI